MDDYISREAAKQRIRDSFPDLAHRCEINAILNSIPAADVRPVVRGMWIDKWFCSNMTGYEYAMKCSNCGKPTYRISIIVPMPIFCPNCGADMREVKADDTDSGDPSEVP